MYRIAWLTDIHLDFVQEDALDALASAIVSVDPHAILLGGDIGEAKSLPRYLRRLHNLLGRPIYFVLGNHDFYGGGIQAVRDAAGQLADALPDLHYLTLAAEPIPITDRLALIGHDGWADAREGDYNGSLVMMNDYLLIEELARFSKHDRLAELHRLGDQAAHHIRSQLTLAFGDFHEVLLLTHVPPFRSACWYQGRISDDEWAPHFVCQAMGRAILDLASVHPEKSITVLCGHTHSPGSCQPMHNVKVITGGAEYGSPRITQTLEMA